MPSGVLDGKVAFVTGAARGLGLYLAQGMIEAGAKVALAARSAEALREHAQRLGPAALAAPCDVADPDSVRAAFAATAEAFGGLDILVNNATLNHAHRIADITDAEAQAEVGVNVLGPIYCMREAIALMRPRGGGDIVNISSESVFRPFPLLSLYAATKAAIETLAVGMREELRAENIRVTTLRSGVVAGGGAFMAGSDPEMMAEYRRQATAGYYPQASGKAIDPSITARAMIDLITAPRESHIDIISVRAI